MLVNAISFEIRDFSAGTAENYLVPNNELNYALIASHKSTRDIHFIDVFSFQFEKEMKCPEFMQLSIIADVVARCGAEHELEFDSIDEMVGVY